MEIIDPSGQWIPDVRRVVHAARWLRGRSSCPRPRARMDLLYAPEMPIAWQGSVDVLRRPVVSGWLFIHRAPAATIKWFSRVRAGCLATRLRRFRRLLVDYPACPCCGEAEEDDVHVLVG